MHYQKLHFLKWLLKILRLMVSTGIMHLYWCMPRMTTITTACCQFCYTLLKLFISCKNTSYNSCQLVKPGLDCFTAYSRPCSVSTSPFCSRELPTGGCLFDVRSLLTSPAAAAGTVVNLHLLGASLLSSSDFLYNQTCIIHVLQKLTTEMHFYQYQTSNQLHN